METMTAQEEDTKTGKQDSSAENKNAPSNYKELQKNYLSNKRENLTKRWESQGSNKDSETKKSIDSVNNFISETFTKTDLYILSSLVGGDLGLLTRKKQKTDDDQKTILAYR